MNWARVRCAYRSENVCVCVWRVEGKARVCKAPLHPEALAILPYGVHGFESGFEFEVH